MQLTKPPLPLRIRVLIQEYQGRKWLRTKTVTVYEATFQEVLSTVRRALETGSKGGHK